MHPSMGQPPMGQPPMAPSPMGAPPPPPPPPPPVVAPPPLVSPGVLSPSASPHLSQKVLVGFLVTFQNEPTGSFWALYSGRTTLGRAGADNKVDIGVNDASASSRHAAIVADSATGQAFAEDDGSRNGTFLNEQKIGPSEQRQMHDNDRLRCGSTTFVVKLLVS